MRHFLVLRRNKKKKIPLVNNEEVDMDLSAMDDSPVLWIRSGLSPLYRYV
jgi:hypothetical protein